MSARSRNILLDAKNQPWRAPRWKSVLVLPSKYCYIHNFNNTTVLVAIHKHCAMSIQKFSIELLL